MKLAVIETTAGDAAERLSGRRAVRPTFDDCRALAQCQSGPIAAKLEELIDWTETAIARGDADRFVRAHRLEQAVCYISQVRPGHAESQQLQRMVARLLHEAFRSPDWRAPFISAGGARWNDID